MSKYAYPAIFTKEESGLYFVNFPDLEGCSTQGSDVTDALFMAQDVLSLILCDMEDDGNKIPNASNLGEIQTDENSFASLISADTVEYRKKYDSKTIRKNCTIPAWLNTAAEKENINFSATLQQALMERLNIG